MKNPVFIDFIRNVLPMPEEKAKQISTFFNEATYPKNEMLVCDGKVAEQYYYILSGFARSYTYDLNGDDITTGFYGRGQVMCDLDSFFRRIPSKENYLVLSKITCLEINFEKVQLAFHSVPEFREWGRTMLIRAYAELKNRMLSSLHQTAEERYLTIIKANPEIFQYASLKDIASYLGITDSSLSRIRREVAKK